MLFLLIIALAPLVNGAIVADPPPLPHFSQLQDLEKYPNPLETIIPERLVKLYKKLERFTAPQTERPVEKLYEKLDRLNSLTPEKFDADDDEELLDAMQEWGMTDEQIDDVIKGMREGEEYGDWNDEDSQDLADDDYAMDGSEDLDPEEEEKENQEPQGTFIPSLNHLGSTTAKIIKMAPSALNRLEPEPTASVLDLIAATEERPEILDDSDLSIEELKKIRKVAKLRIGTNAKNGKCLLPQPRWLSVRQLAPSAAILYVPPGVQLHRCANDTGCCREGYVCAPAKGHHVAIPLLLNGIRHNLTAARMRFFNHTSCKCVSEEALRNPQPRTPRRQTTVAMVTSTHHTVQPPTRGIVGNAGRVGKVMSVEKENVSSVKSVGSVSSVDSVGSAGLSDVTTEEPKPESETTAPPQLRSCTCPTLFMARLSEAGCACVCDWADPARSRDCLSLSRGREHFGMRDRVCVAGGSCTEPTCVFGSYDQKLGRCPLRRALSGGSDAISDHLGDGFGSVTNPFGP